MGGGEPKQRLKLTTLNAISTGCHLVTIYFNSNQVKLSFLTSYFIYKNPFQSIYGNLKKYQITLVLSRCYLSVQNLALTWQAIDGYIGFTYLHPLCDITTCKGTYHSCELEPLVSAKSCKALTIVNQNTGITIQAIFQLNPEFH